MRKAYAYQPKCHRDGSVTYWSVYHQVWTERVRYVPDRELAAMPSADRERVLRHLARRQEEAVEYGYHPTYHRDGSVSYWYGPIQ